jgi:hypothetical protein
MEFDAQLTSVAEPHHFYAAPALALALAPAPAKAPTLLYCIPPQPPTEPPHLPTEPPQTPSRH